jgi:hypothetical protein
MNCVTVKKGMKFCTICTEIIVQNIFLKKINKLSQFFSLFFLLQLFTIIVKFKTKKIKISQ